MPATAVAVTKISRTGIAPVAFANSDPTNHNSVVNDGNVWLEFSNTDVSSHSFTVALARSVDGQAVTPTTHNVAAGAQLRIGPFPVSDYGPSLDIHTTDVTLKIAAYSLADH